MSVNTCPQCGAPIEPGAKRCRYCWTPVQEEYQGNNESNACSDTDFQDGPSGSCTETPSYQNDDSCKETSTDHRTDSYAETSTYHDNRRTSRDSDKSRAVALILCILVGVLGVHRFYVGKVGTGILWLFTLGFWGIGVLIDFILILAGAFKDDTGRYISVW